MGIYKSRPTRGAWIETSRLSDEGQAKMSRPTRGAWIETLAVMS